MHKSVIGSVAWYSCCRHAVLSNLCTTSRYRGGSTLTCVARYSTLSLFSWGSIRLLFSRSMRYFLHITFSLDNFLSKFNHCWDDWAVMTASQTSRYYEMWSLRSKWVPFDCWRMVDLHRQLNMIVGVPIATFVSQHQQLAILENHDLVEVDSAFSGFAIYQTRYLQHCTYSGWENVATNCKHVTSHRCKENNSGRIFINPSFQHATWGAWIKWKFFEKNKCNTWNLSLIEHPFSSFQLSAFDRWDSTLSRILRIV